MNEEEAPGVKSVNSPGRRRFFHVMAGAAGFTAVAGLSTQALAAKRFFKCLPEQLPCFLRGTHILTSSGNVPVEALSIGDRVITVSGQHRPIKWIGRRAFRRGATPNWPDNIQPIRVARSALSDSVPSTDLYLSPLHALYLDGVLIPVKHLVNGATIRPGTPEGIQDIEYFHIELETHDVVLAEGAPVETFREIDNREIFGNFAEYLRLYGREQHGIPPPYAPVAHYRGRRDRLKALLRLGVSRVVDVRDPIQVAYDRLAERAAVMAL